MNSGIVGISANQSQLIRNTRTTLPILPRAVFIPTGRNFNAQKEKMRLIAPVNPEAISFGKYSGRRGKLSGAARSRSGDMDIISERFLTVATESPSCLRTW